MVVALVLSAGVTGQAVGQAVVTIAVDVDVTGNGPRTVGTIENCARIDSSGTNELEIDIVLPDPGIPTDVGIKGYQANLLYDPAVVNVTAEDPNLLLSQAQGSLLLPLSDFLPDTDGDYLAAVADRGEQVQIQPEGSIETGPGVLSRITLTGVSKGTTDLTLTNVILVGIDNNPIPLRSVLSAAVSVDTACEPPPVSAPSPGTGTGSPTAPGAGTPQPGTPGAGTPATGTPADGAPASGVGAETSDQGTPDGGGTPVSEGAGGEASGAADSDSGLSAGAWAGIGVGIAAVVLAASGAGWFALRRRRAGGTPKSGGEAGSG